MTERDMLGNEKTCEPIAIYLSLGPKVKRMDIVGLATVGSKFIIHFITFKKTTISSLKFQISKHLFIHSILLNTSNSFSRDIIFQTCKSKAKMCEMDEQTEIKDKLFTK